MEPVQAPPMTDPSLAEPQRPGWFERLRQRPAFVQHVDLPLT